MASGRRVFLLLFLSALVNTGADKPASRGWRSPRRIKSASPHDGSLGHKDVRPHRIIAKMAHHHRPKKALVARGLALLAPDKETAPVLENSWVGGDGENAETKMGPTLEPTNSPTATSLTEMGGPQDGDRNGSQKLDPKEGSSPEMVVTKGVVMHLHGVGSFGSHAERLFATEYREYAEEYYRWEGVDVEISIDINSVRVRPASRHLFGNRFEPAQTRSLEGSGTVVVTFDQTTLGHIPTGVTIEDFLRQPFNKKEDRDNFVASLLQHKTFEGLGSVSHLGIVAPPAGVSKPTDATAASRGIAIAAAVSAFCSMLLMGGGCFLRGKYRRTSGTSAGYTVEVSLASDTMSKDKSDLRSQLDLSAPVGGGDHSSGPWQLSTIGGDDGISTLAPPSAVETVVPQKIGANFLHRRSGDSDTDSTSDEPDQGSPYTLSQNDSHSAYLSAASPSVVGAPSVTGSCCAFTGSASFDDSSQQHPQIRIMNKGVMDVYAPSGRLGLLIDVMEPGGSPFIHSVKDRSPLSGQIFPGDRLTTVDEVDVTHMSSFEVTKLITDRGSNPARRLRVVRTIT